MAYLRGGVILPEVALYCTLRYIAGGSYSDVSFMAGISTASFYSILCKTIYISCVFLYRIVVIVVVIHGVRLE
jgi:hypothetical protein